MANNTSPFEKSGAHAPIYFYTYVRMEHDIRAFMDNIKVPLSYQPKIMYQWSQFSNRNKQVKDFDDDTYLAHALTFIIGWLHAKECVHYGSQHG